jgi:hypothetical protein
MRHPATDVAVVHPADRLDRRPDRRRWDEDYRRGVSLPGHRALHDRLELRSHEDALSPSPLDSSSSLQENAFVMKMRSIYNRNGVGNTSASSPVKGMSAATFAGSLIVAAQLLSIQRLRLT